jgi:hypothetical protein
LAAKFVVLPPAEVTLEPVAIADMSPPFLETNDALPQLQSTRFPLRLPESRVQEAF